MRIGFVRILLVESNRKILSIGNKLDGFPSTFARTIAKPIDQIIKFVANKFGVEDSNNFILRGGGGVTRSGIVFAL